MDHRVVSCAVQVVVGINTEGYKEILAIVPMLNESSDTYSAFFNSLKERGMTTPLMVISDAYSGLKGAIRESSPDASWQRCKVHFQRNINMSIPNAVKGSLLPILNRSGFNHAMKKQ